MARPIRDTPTLRGKAARRFLRRMKEVDEGKIKTSAQEMERIKKNYERLKSIARF